MDYKGQIAVLSGFVLVGMVFLVPAITEKALANVRAGAKGTCGPGACVFTFKGKELKGTDASNVIWDMIPTCSTLHLPIPKGSSFEEPSGGSFHLEALTSPGDSPCTLLQWKTGGKFGSCSAGATALLSAKFGCDEEGSVQVLVGGGEASLYFNSPGRMGIPSTCDVKILDAGPGKLSGSCNTQDLQLTTTIDYNLHSASVGSTQAVETCKELKATIAEDELANSAQWKNMQCESLLK